MWAFCQASVRAGHAHDDREKGDGKLFEALVRNRLLGYGGRTRIASVSRCSWSVRRAIWSEKDFLRRRTPLIAMITIWMEFGMFSKLL